MVLGLHCHFLQGAGEREGRRVRRRHRRAPVLPTSNVSSVEKWMGTVFSSRPSATVFSFTDNVPVPPRSVCGRVQGMRPLIVSTDADSADSAWLLSTPDRCLPGTQTVRRPPAWQRFLLQARPVRQRTSVDPGWLGRVVSIFRPESASLMARLSDGLCAWPSRASPG